MTVRRCAAALLIAAGWLEARVAFAQHHSEAMALAAWAQPAAYSAQPPAEVGTAFASDALPAAGEDLWGSAAPVEGLADCGQPGACGGSRLWVRAEYLYWWVQGSELPPLLTASPAGTPRAQAGVLGEDFTETETTDIIFGDETVNTGPRSGGRLNVGWWLDETESMMAAGDFFAIGDDVTRFSASGQGFPILARPFFNVEPDAGLPRQDAALVVFPGVITGSVNVALESDILGAAGYFRHTLHRSCSGRFDLLYGYRFLRFDENLMVTENLVTLDPAGLVAIGTMFDTLDVFDAENQFHGGEIGAVWEIERGRWGLAMLGRVALGNNRQEVTIRGQTITTVPGGGSVVTPGGLLAQPTNIGDYENDDFAVLPEATFTLSYCLTPRLRATAGYTFMYLDNVVRAGDQVDLFVNPTQFAGGALVGEERPEFTLRQSELWMQGVNLGFEFKR